MSGEALFAVALIALPLLFARPILRWMRAWLYRASNRKQLAAWQAEFEAANPPGPPLTDTEVEGWIRWYRALALPAVELEPVVARIRAGGTRIGGPVWLAQGSDWPADASGTPLEFVAQVDFGELPPIAGYPHSGLLQFFVGRDDLLGADFDAPERGSARLIWHEQAPEDAAPLTTPPPLFVDQAGPNDASESSPFHSERVRSHGQALVGRAAVHDAPASDWRVVDRFEGNLRRPGIDRVQALVEAAATPALYHVGGHPAFTQDDFRSAERYGEHDRVLLRLTSGPEGLCWGDMGEAVFLIARADLDARRFDRALFYWDCS